MREAKQRRLDGLSIRIFAKNPSFHKFFIRNSECIEAHPIKFLSNKRLHSIVKYVNYEAFNELKLFTIVHIPKQSTSNAMHYAFFFMFCQFNSNFRCNRFQSLNSLTNEKTLSGMNQLEIDINIGP